MGMPIELSVVEPNLYFVLDHSRSMLEMSKWTNVRQVVAQVIGQIGAGARFGAMMFPGTSDSGSCVAGTEVMSLRQGDGQGVVSNQFLAATTPTPNGGTPTAATLESLVPKLGGLQGPAFVILATDGGPNCNGTLSCAVDRCTTNIDDVDPMACPPGDPTMNCCSNNPLGCLDDTSAIAAAGDVAAAGIKTYVLGIPGSAPYGALLDNLAIAGGTARLSEPRYYQVNSADDAALAVALGQIVDQTGAGCTFTLANPPTITTGLRVILNGMLLPDSGPDRWSLAGTTLTLHGASCSAVQSAGAPSLQFFDGCRG
jgi:hypothetical protein